MKAISVRQFTVLLAQYHDQIIALAAVKNSDLHGCAVLLNHRKSLHRASSLAFGAVSHSSRLRPDTFPLLGETVC